MFRGMLYSNCVLALLAGAFLIGAGEPVHAQAPKDKPHVNIQDVFVASGWMGDGEYGRKYIDFSGADQTDPHSEPDSIRIDYRFGGPKLFAGMYWQNLPNNWGDRPGSDYSARGFSKVSFWARGADGGEIVEFKVGGIDKDGKKYRDSLTETLGRVRLKKEWTRYVIKFSKEESVVRCVIGGFCWTARSVYNPAKKGITFYLDDIIME
jgi:hypothetical protein